MQKFQTPESQSIRSWAEKPHVLLIDDDRRIRELLKRYLGDHGFMVMAVKSGREAAEILEHFSFDGLIVDVMMPGQTGLEFTRQIRKTSDIPVLMLTALGETNERIEGLEAGADDYLPKPFEPKELLLRLQALLRRNISARSPVGKAYQIGRWQYRTDLDELRDAGELIKLTATEGTLLRSLVLKNEQTLSREELARSCGIKAGERTIDVQVTRLRKKIEEDSKNPRYLLTLRGKGYVLRAKEI